MSTTTTEQEMQQTKRPRGFAVMDKQRHREICSTGGRAAHAQGSAHEFTSEEARAAGRRGGSKVAANREHMAEIGRLGGFAAGVKRAAAAKARKEAKVARSQPAE